MAMTSCAAVDDEKDHQLNFALSFGGACRTCPSGGTVDNSRTMPGRSSQSVGPVISCNSVAIARPKW